MRALVALCSWPTLFVALFSVEVLNQTLAASHPEWRRNSPRHWLSLRPSGSELNGNSPKKEDENQPSSSPSPRREIKRAALSHHPRLEDRYGIPPDRAEVVVLVPASSRRENVSHETEGRGRRFLSASSNVEDYSDYKPRGVAPFASVAADDYSNEEPFFRRSSVKSFAAAASQISDSSTDRVTSSRSFSDIIQRRGGSRTFSPDVVRRHHHHVDSEEQFEPRAESPSLPKRHRARIPVRALSRAGTAPPSQRRRDKVQSSTNQITSQELPAGETRLITLHSPTRIFIPVRLRADNALLATPDHKECVQCPEDQTLIPGRGENCIPVPVPAVSVCPYLAHVKGRVNVAVTSGPRPGSMIPEGEYPVEVIVWKNGGHVYSCQYRLTVKVQKCSLIEVPDGGSVDCSNGTTWGSRCRFTCEPDFVLRGHHAITCEGNEKGVSWTAAIPKCKWKRFSSSSSDPCSEPQIPSDGTFVCDAPNHGGLYRDGAVCQYFCYPGYQMIPEQKNNAIVICKGGTWIPTVDVHCSASHCPRPRAPPQGSLRCQGTDPPKQGDNEEELLRNGTRCEFRCQVGYVIPTSQLPLHVTTCNAPQWNTSAIPDCKRAVPPGHHPDDCRNETLTIERGGRATISYPRFTSGTGRSLIPTCALGESLPSGLHLNFCEVTDPELRVTTTCSYHIVVKERLVPRPHPSDCKNQTLKASRRGTAVLKISRFTSGSGRSLPVTCTHSGQLAVGKYWNHCTAKDPEFNTTGNCSYYVIVKERACPPPPEVAHAVVKCRPTSSHLHPRTVCEYVCHEGYVIPTSQKKIRKRKCLPKLKWDVSAVPSCRKAVPPRLHSQDCKNQTLFVRTGKKVRIKPPRFKSVSKSQSVRVQCSLPKALPLGTYINLCEAEDKELRLSSSCNYSITIKARSCLSPIPIKDGDVECDSGKSDGYRVSTVCRYVCHPGHVIPTDQLNLVARNCTSQREWNITRAPTCVKLIPPRPVGSTCEDRVLLSDDPSSVAVDPPEFLSASGSLLPANCTPKVIAQHGSHNITCESYDPRLRNSALCSFRIDIQPDNSIAQFDVEECSAPPSIPHGVTECIPVQLHRYKVETVCQYVCQEEYLIPTSQLSLVTWKCVSGAQWNNTLAPTCLKDTAPNPIGSSCSDRVLTNDSLPFLVEPPEFVSSLEARLSSNCTPNEVTEYGLYNITCEAYDPELRISATCAFSVDFQAPPSTEKEEDILVLGCPLPPMVENSDVICNSSQTVFPELTLCEYVCQRGYFIPNNQREFSAILCSTELQWNATEIPVCKAQPPRAVNGDCEDHSIETSDLGSVSIPLPLFVTALNQSAKVTCSPQDVTNYGVHDVTCTAVDLQLGSESICTFEMIVSRMESNPETENETLPEEDKSKDTLERGKNCPPLLSPTNGHVTCASRTVSRCNVSCEKDFHFPSAYPFFERGYVLCNSSEGMWDFQKHHHLDQIPDCLAELSTTSLQTWLKFKMAVRECSETLTSFLKTEIKDRLLIMNHDICEEVDCTMFDFNCTEDADRNQDAIEVGWTIQATFSPEDYEYINDVPNVETQIEMILETTQRAVTTEPKFQQEIKDLGLELWQDSYRQGRFQLVCQRMGFAVDPRTDKCVQCPSGFAEVNRKCEPCPADHYQEKTGQTGCIPCPDDRRSAVGSRSISECRG